jgi:hypothetical protein
LGDWQINGIWGWQKSIAMVGGLADKWDMGLAEEDSPIVGGLADKRYMGLADEDSLCCGGAGR